MQMDVQNVQIVTRRSKLGLPGSRNCTKHIITPRTAGILLQRSNEIKKKLKNGTLDGFLCPRPTFVASTVQPIPLIRSLPIADTATPQSDNVIPCKQMGCESKWVSFY